MEVHLVQSLVLVLFVEQFFLVVENLQLLGRRAGGLLDLLLDVPHRLFIFCPA